MGKFDKPLSPEIATVKAWMRRYMSETHSILHSFVSRMALWICALAMHTGNTEWCLLLIMSKRLEPLSAHHRHCIALSQSNCRISFELQKQFCPKKRFFCTSPLRYWYQLENISFVRHPLLYVYSNVKVVFFCCISV